MPLSADMQKGGQIPRYGQGGRPSPSKMRRWAATASFERGSKDALAGTVMLSRFKVISEACQTLSPLVKSDFKRGQLSMHLR